MWHVNIGTDWVRGTTRIYIWTADADGRNTKMLRSTPNGLAVLEDWPDSVRDQDAILTLTLNARDARDILQGLTEQLAQLGYGTPDAGPLIRAKDGQIASLEKIIDRLMSKVSGASG
jgi:hypothetical protein